MASAIANLTSAKSAIEFIDGAVPLVASCGIDDQQKLIDNVLENFDEMRCPNEISEKDFRVRLYYMLRSCKQQLLSEMLSCFIVVSPHSMTVEKCVSTYNILFSDLRMATSAETLID